MDTNRAKKHLRVWCLSLGYLVVVHLLGSQLTTPVLAKTSPTQHVDTSYLAEMPDPPRVLQDMQGKDEFDTAIRQKGAFHILGEALEVRTLGRVNHNELTKEEATKREAYRQEETRLREEWLEKLPPCKNGNDTTCPRVRLRNAGLSPALKKEILDRYVSKRWQEGYRRELAAMEQRIKQYEADQRALMEERRRNPVRINHDAFPIMASSVPSLGLGEIAIGLVILWVIWRVVTYKRRKQKWLAAEQAAAKRPDLAAWKQLGATVEAREQAIKKLFDKKEGSLNTGARWDWQEPNSRGTKDDYFIQFRISRSLAAMEPREREFLRTAYLLFNANQINADQFAYYCFAFINGNGKATVDKVSYEVSQESGIKNGPGAIRFYQDEHDASVDSAVNALLGVMEKLGQGGAAPAVVQEIKGRLHGGGAWLAPEEVPSTLFSSNGAYAVRLGLLDGSQTPLSYGGEGSLITIAPPGSGKTQCFVLPTMLSWPGPAVVLDVKGEIYTATSKWRAQHIGPVFKFSPLDPANSHSYNPLTFIRQDPEYLWEDARFLADMMIVPSGAADPFWENTARDVLTSAIAYVSYLNPPDQRPIAKIMDLIYGIGWDDMVLSLKTNMAVSAMRQIGHSLSEMEKKTRDSVLKTAQSSLSAWQGERISRATKKSDWSPLDLRTGKPTIYICINPNEIDSYLSILRVLIAQHIRMLTSQLPPREAAPVLFVLDEMPRLKKMPPIDEALNVGRQYGIRLWMFAQSYGQLKDAYSNPEGMLGSCTVRTFMNVPLNDELAQKLSDQLGYRDGPLDASRTKLVEPLELAGPTYKDLVLVVATNTKPAKVRKAFAYQDPTLAAKMGSA